MLTRESCTRRSLNIAPSGIRVFDQNCIYCQVQDAFQHEISDNLQESTLKMLVNSSSATMMNFKELVVTKKERSLAYARQAHQKLWHQVARQRRVLYEDSFDTNVAQGQTLGKHIYCFQSRSAELV